MNKVRVVGPERRPGSGPRADGRPPRRRRRRLGKPKPLFYGVLAIAIALIAVLVTVLARPGEDPAAVEDPATISENGETAGEIDPLTGEPVVEEEETPVSTPIDQWRQGEYPELYQTDAAWADEPYAGGTIETHGCGPTALATVYIGLTGKTDQTPVTVAELSEDSGYVQGGETTSNLFVGGAAQLGLTGREFAVGTDELLAELEAGHPVIANLEPGDFTQVGHYVALVGLDDKGNVIIRDSNSPENTHRTWSPFQILRQARFLWTFDVA